MSEPILNKLARDLGVSEMETQNNPSNLGESTNHVDHIDAVAGISNIAEKTR